MLESNPVKVKRRKLSDDVVKQLETAISDGVYLPGDQLPSERVLMAQFGVGRPSIREALFGLRRMGLIEMPPGERARVVRPTPGALVSELSGVVHHLLATPEGMRSFQQARSLFETALVDYAARHATVEDLNSLRAALEANERAVSNQKQFEKTDVAFHYVLAQIPHNPILTALHAGIAEWLAEQRSISILAAGSIPAALHAHKRIFEAIAAGNPDDAREAMAAHLKEVEEYYWAARSE